MLKLFARMESGFIENPAGLKEEPIITQTNETVYIITFVTVTDTGKEQRIITLLNMVENSLIISGSMVGITQ